jgi:multidrug efflux pump
VLTLYTTPVIYIFFDRLSQRFGKSRAAHTEPSMSDRPAAPGPEAPEAPA